MAEKVYNWTDDPMISGVADCNTDVVNDCLMHLKYENTSDAIQNMYETGQVEKQTRGFTQLQQMRRSTFDLSKFTVVGSPTITDDGVVSGFSNGNYLTIPLSFQPTDDIEFEFEWEVHESNWSGAKVVLGGTNNIKVGSFQVYHYANSCTIALFVNKDGTITPQQVGFGTDVNLVGKYKVHYKKVGTNYTITLYKPNGTSETKTISNANGYNLSVNSIQVIGKETNTNTTADLKNLRLKVNGKEVFNGNKTGIDIIKPDNYEVVGSPVISADGVASGFSGSNYLQYIFDKEYTLDQLDIRGKFKTPSVGTLAHDIVFSLNNTDITGMQGTVLQLSCFFTGGNAGKISIAGHNGTTWEGWYSIRNDISFNKEYYYHIYYQNGNIYLDLSSDNVNYIQYVNKPITIDSTFKANRLQLGSIQSNLNHFTGSIDLNAFKIYVDGQLVYQPCLKIPYTQSKTGSKIVDVAYRDRVIDLYEQEGQAGYYTIDEENKNFTLPMGEIYGMIESKATYQPPLLSTMWSDHLLNDMSWLRADTFSWQNGTTYSSVYNELLSEYNNSASTTKTDGSITYKLTPKGYKIALANQETAILNKYNSDGIAWYYILDTTNKKFKLPRTKFGFEGLRTSVGDDIKAGLPNITGTWTGAERFTVPQKGTGAITWIDAGGGYSGGYGGAQGSGFNFDASRSNPIYGNSNTVQPPATQMYLYFYVGNFTKSAESQTAGLNSELLNGKADVDTPSIQAPYITDTYVNGTSWYRIWSDGWCEQGGIVSLTNNQTLTVNLLKSYKNSTYSILQSPLTTNYTDVWGYGTKIVSLTNSSFNIYINSSTSGKVCWQASGYIN